MHVPPSPHHSRRAVVGVVGAAGVVAAGLVGATAPSPAALARGPAAQHRAAGRIDGFTPASSARERAAEKAFMTYPSASLARSIDKQLARHTSMVGTRNDRRRAHEIVQRLRSFGLRPHVSVYHVYMSSPRKVSLTMTSPVRFHAANRERCRTVETDCRHTVVGYNALAPSGDVTAPVVYVNYGTTDDYAELARQGVSVEGKIALARYGAVYRGVKVNLAAEHGAVGVVLYSDPADDGNVQGPVYPHGPWRAPDGIQRGSVQQLWQYPGDPQTRGRPSLPGVRRTSAKGSIAKLPSVPIGYGSARPILAHLGGPAAPDSFQGGLPLTYRLGSGATLHLHLDVDYRVRPVYDITVTIPGRTRPDEVVQLGAHHDAWTYGSDDNLSGAESVLQIGRALHRLMATGWRPERTIRFGTWDGEEYGLFGSTEYAEDAGRSRLGHLVAYLNMDIAAGQDFDATSVPSMDRLIRDVAKQVPWPGTDGTAYDNWAASTHTTVPTPERLGSGSDYTSFFDHFGVPSADIGSSTPSGDYHCSCDNFFMEDHFIDPGWRHHVAIAQVVGLAVLRLADADVVPLHYRPYAAEVGGYLADLAAQQQQAFGHQVVHLSRDRRQARAWAKAATAVQAEVDRRLAAGDTAGATMLTRRLERVERQLLVGRGLPGRPWYRHQIYAPGVNSGYGTQVLPGINDALFLHRSPAQARRYEASLYASLRSATRTLQAG